MGICYGKSLPADIETKQSNGSLASAENEVVENPNSAPAEGLDAEVKATEERAKAGLPAKSPYRVWASPYRGSPFRSPFRSSNGTSPANGTPGRFFKRPFPPPSPAKHIQAALAKRFGTAKLKEGPIPEGEEVEKPLDKAFGYSKNFNLKYELGQEVGRGHFGHTCLAKIKKGELKGLSVAVKIIAKAKCQGCEIRVQG